jgi:large subunit ribosomal protein L15
MRISELSPAKGSRKRKKRVGRGCGSGHGKTSCRGHKGQNARSGGGVKRGFEGGQMPLYRRIPKIGFRNIFGKEYAIVGLGDLNRLSESEITPEIMTEKGLIKDVKDGIKILANGEITKPLKVRAHAFSASARDKIIKAGGSVEIIQN